MPPTILHFQLWRGVCFLPGLYFFLLLETEVILFWFQILNNNNYWINNVTNCDRIMYRRQPIPTLILISHDWLCNLIQNIYAYSQTKTFKKQRLITLSTIVYKWWKIKNFDLLGFLGDLASWKGFQITSRLSYTFYLTQFPVFFYNVGRTRHSDYYTIQSLVNIVLCSLWH